MGSGNTEDRFNTLQIVVIISAVIGVLLFGFGINFPFQIEPANARIFLSSLATAQASVLAIVFSVTLIAIQLVAPQYTPRLGTLPIQSSELITVFGYFLVSFSLDLALIIQVPTTASGLFTGGLLAAGWVGIMGFVLIVVFAREIIEQSSPEGVIEQIENNFTTEGFLSEVEATANNDIPGIHPLQNLFSVIMESLSRQERNAAEVGVQKYGRLAQRALEDFIASDVFENRDHTITEKLFDPILTEHLHDIALHAEGVGETRIAKLATNWQYKLGKTALNTTDRTVIIQAVSGIYQVITHAPIDEGEFAANNGAWQAGGNLLVGAAEYPRPDSVSMISRRLEGRVGWQISETDDLYQVQDTMTELYRDIKSAHDHVIINYSGELTHTEFPQDGQGTYQADSLDEGVRAVLHLRNLLIRSSSTFFQYAIDEGQYPITDGNFRDSWKAICIRACDSEATQYATTLCQSLIEMAFIGAIEGPFGDGGPDHFAGEVQSGGQWLWIHALAGIKHEGGEDIVEAAFQQMLSYESQDDQPSIPLSVDQQTEIEETYYQSYLNIPEYRYLNTCDEYPELLEDIHREVNRQFNRLQK